MSMITPPTCSGPNSHPDASDAPAAEPWVLLLRSELEEDDDDLYGDDDVSELDEDELEDGADELDDDDDFDSELDV
jgi:hypothetical protein